MTLLQLRRQIDRVDRQLLRLLNERARLGLAVGRLKKRNGLKLFDPVRERDILARLAAVNAGPLSSVAVSAIYRQILQQTRRTERAA